MKNTFKDDAKVFGAIMAAVTVATLSGCGIGYAAATSGPSIQSYKAERPGLARAVKVVAALTKQGSPSLKAPVYFTDFDFIEENGHAVSSVRAQGCEVTINNDVTDTDFNTKLKLYTGWDDEQVAIFVAAHELQHCVTMDDVHRVAFSKTALSDREAHALHAFVWGTGIAKNVARHPRNRVAIKQLEDAGEKPVFVRANESISDVTGLIMVQQLSKKGLTLHAVQGLQRLRAEFSPDPIYNSHHTVPALKVFETKLQLDETFGKYIAPEHVAQVAYQIVGMSKPENEYTKITPDDLKKERLQYITTTSLDI